MFTCRVKGCGHSTHEKVASFQSTVALGVRQCFTQRAAVLAPEVRQLGVSRRAAGNVIVHAMRSQYILSLKILFNGT